MQSLIYARLLSQVWKLNVIAAFCLYSTGIASGDSNVTLSPLQKAIERGLGPAGKLGDEVYALKDYKVNSKDDAKAICMALASLSDSALKETGYGSPLYVLTGLFQDVDGADCPAFPILRDEGIKQLIKVYDSLAQNPTDDEADDLLMVLKMLALYGTHEGAERIVAAAQKSLKSDDYMWSVVLSILQEEHPEREFVFSSLAKQLPEGFIGIALLDAANQAAIKENFKPHPFNSDQGVAKLRNWITSKNPEEYSYCHSAVVALPFINHADRDTLLGLAREHDDAGVRMEAAWASAKIGQKIGLDMLVEFSRDSIHSATAVQYLEELGRKDSVPMEALEPDFQAKAEFSNWLAHPNELGEPPDELEIVDHRVLKWPTSEEEIPVWVIRFVKHDSTGLEPDQVDCGLVGPMTWCFFSANMNQRPPEDVYAIHCSWELSHDGLIEDVDIEEPAKYRQLFSQWQGKPLQNAELRAIKKIAFSLKYGRRLVALAKAEIDDQPGWAVLDGPRSEWYPSTEVPEGEEHQGYVLELHIGRNLLGFTGTPDRKKYMANVPKPKLPEEIVVAYERILQEAVASDVNRRKELLADSHSPLGRYLLAYADAKQKTNGKQRRDTVIETYELMLELVKVSPDLQADAYDSFSPLGDTFEEYCEAVIESGDKKKVTSLIQIYEPYLDNNLGYGRLGTAAYRIGDYATAERFFLKLRESYDNYERSDQMGYLAEIWLKKGKSKEAQQLLLECLRRLADDAKAATGSDRNLYEEWFQSQRKTYLRLFPEGSQDLAKTGIPDSTKD